MNLSKNSLFCALGAAAGAAALAVAGSGCASMGYSLGSMLPPEIQTVHVPTVVNQTDEPQVAAEVTRAVIDQIQIDGSLKVAAREDADSILQVTLTRYRIVPISYEKTRRTAAEEYRVFISARILLTHAATGDVLAETPFVQGDSTFELQGDMTSSKRLALPEVARDLAHDIVEKVVEYW